MNKEKLYDALFASFVLLFIVASAAALVFGPKLAANPPPARTQCVNLPFDDGGGSVVIVCYQAP